MRNLRSFLVMFFVSFQAYGQGVDLNPALLGCIMSGGACLSHTGIPFVDQIFGGGVVPRHTDESFCRVWLTTWCTGPAGYPSAFKKCKEAKKEFWKSARERMGESTSEKGTDFNCTPRQEYIWLKNRCGHTQEFKKFRDFRPGRIFKEYTPEEFSKMKTRKCDEDFHY